MLEYRGFHAETSYDEQDRLFVGRVTGIRDFLFFHGTTAEELETAFHDCIENYLDFLNEKTKRTINLQRR